ncbi:unnamed protein product [Euphydryas editha]|uniref:Uncharacterized protein n=1 Tax=Euphydryas editha TaxID=104508 RepID=A0AAU9TYW3_EUPED|nr:unnamed protein product [Euphydryas editha]
MSRFCVNSPDLFCFICGLYSPKSQKNPDNALLTKCYRSRLKQWNLLQPDVCVTAYRKRHNSYVDFYSKDGDLIYCNNVVGLLAKLGHQNLADEWILFIDSSKTSLKAVLLHIGNQFPSIPVAYGAQFT